LNYKSNYNDILLIYQRMLFNFGIAPSQLDIEDADVVFEVLGAREREKIGFIDEI